ncbi:MAG: glycine--tRNA ligase, partial [Planctomycetota bacterium]
AGTPYCITIDGDTVESDSPQFETVTVRDRDSLAQERVHKDQVLNWLADKLDA